MKLSEEMSRRNAGYVDAFHYMERVRKLEEQLDKCVEFFEGENSKLAQLEAVVEAGIHFAAAGYAEPQMDWRQPLLDALADLEDGECVICRRK